MSARILIVEDEAPLAEILRYNLEGEKFETEIARDGREALLALDENPPDLVVLDWMLPELSGLDVCRAMRRKPELCAIPVIMLTARETSLTACAASTPEPTTTCRSRSPRAN